MIAAPTAEHQRALDSITHPPHAIQVGIGRWPGETTWGLYLSDQQPADVVTTAAAGVAIRNLQNREVVLTLNPEEDQQSRVNMWEIPAGHIDPVDPDDPDGARESPAKTLVREFLEEAGFQTTPGQLRCFGYMLMLNPPGSDRPEVGCMPYCYAISSVTEPLVPAIDPGKPIGAVFPEWSMRRMVANRLMKPLELSIVQYGLAAALNDRQREARL